MYRSHIGCKHKPQITFVIDAFAVDVDVIGVPVDAVAPDNGDLWRWLLSDGDDEFPIRFVCCCTIGDGFICVITPELSTIPAMDAGIKWFGFTVVLLFKLLQFSFDIAICDCCAIEHFISMGTETGGW